jgi:hypothetical protein
MTTKYTKELLEPIVKDSVSFAEVIRKLGLKWSGGTQQNIKKWITFYELNISHFLGEAANSGCNHKGGPDKKHWTEVLVLADVERRSIRLRSALLESGREYKCEKCDNLGEWQGTELLLQIDHKDGDKKNNRPDNLRFLCPNCHWQTENWGRGKSISLTKRNSIKR